MQQCTTDLVLTPYRNENKKFLPSTAKIATVMLMSQCGLTSFYVNLIQTSKINSHTSNVPVTSEY